MLLICVDVRGFGVARFWIFEDPCSSLTLPMFGTETRHCSVAILSGVFGMVFPWVI